MKPAFPSQREGSRLGCYRPPVHSAFTPLWSLHAPHSQHFLESSWQDEEAGCRVRLQTATAEEWPVASRRPDGAFSSVGPGRLDHSNTHQAEPPKCIIVINYIFPFKHGHLTRKESPLQITCTSRCIRLQLPTKQGWGWGGVAHRMLVVCNVLLCCSQRST